MTWQMEKAEGGIFQIVLCQKVAIAGLPATVIANKWRFTGELQGSSFILVKLHFYCSKSGRFVVQGENCAICLEDRQDTFFLVFGFLKWQWCQPSQRNGKLHGGQCLVVCGWDTLFACATEFALISKMKCMQAF